MNIPQKFWVIYNFNTETFQSDPYDNKEEAEDVFSQYAEPGEVIAECTWEKPTKSS